MLVKDKAWGPTKTFNAVRAPGGGASPKKPGGGAAPTFKPNC